MQNNLGRVAVLMGGYSAEREISLQSGAAVLGALLRQGIDAIGFDLVKPDDVLDCLRENKIERAFIALHGRGGEDGVIQAVLETLDIPYTGSDMSASALAMDKRLTKLVWQASGIPTPTAAYLRKAGDWEDLVQRLALPLMIKPSREGSSVGICKVNSVLELEQAWHEAHQFDAEIVLETFVSGAEYTVAILNGRALPMIKLETTREFYDYTAKYEADDTRYLCPCGLDSKKEAEIQQLALEAFNCLGASGWGRVDVMLDAEQQAWFLEANTVPGMTSHSLVPMAAKAAGIDFDQLVLEILQTTLPQ